MNPIICAVESTCPISNDYLISATQGKTKASEDWQPDNFFCGYLWYQTEMKVGDKSYDANIAWGSGGQRIITLKELDLTVVITGHDQEDTIFPQVSKKILPAFIPRFSKMLEGDRKAILFSLTGIRLSRGLDQNQLPVMRW